MIEVHQCKNQGAAADRSPTCNTARWNETLWNNETARGGLGDDSVGFQRWRIRVVARPDCGIGRLAGIVLHEMPFNDRFGPQVRNNAFQPALKYEPKEKLFGQGGYQHG